MTFNNLDIRTFITKHLCCLISCHNEHINLGSLVSSTCPTRKSQDSYKMCQNLFLLLTFSQPKSILSSTNSTITRKMNPHHHNHKKDELAVRKQSLGHLRELQQPGEVTMSISNIEVPHIPTNEQKPQSHYPHILQ